MADSSNAEQQIRDALNHWVDAVTSGGSDAVGRVMGLYAKEAVLLGTFSDSIRNTPEAIRGYFEHFTQLSGLQARLAPPQIRVFGDVAVASGFYTFKHEKGTETATVPARFSMTWVKRSGAWLIVDHHSSVVPKPLA